MIDCRLEPQMLCKSNHSSGYPSILGRLTTSPEDNAKGLGSVPYINSIQTLNQLAFRALWRRGTLLGRNLCWLTSPVIALILPGSGWGQGPAAGPRGRAGCGFVVLIYCGLLLLVV